MKYKKGAYMANQKLETLLNVSMQATQEDRAKSPDLSAGVDEEAGIWEIIVKYTQDLSQFSAKYPGMEIYELLGGYAIIKIKKEYIDSLSQEKQIQFIEKPKRLYFQLSNEKSAACITPVQAGSDNPYGLFGEGVITAIIDSGIDVTNPDFKNENVIKDLDIGIITGYRGQKELIRKSVSNGGYDKISKKIDINTLDAFQGRENDIIIYSTVRTKNSIGFQKEKERVNVAFSRAKDLLIICGDMDFFYKFDDPDNKFVEIIDYIHEHEDECLIISGGEL